MASISRPASPIFRSSASLIVFTTASRASGATTSEASVSEMMTASPVPSSFCFSTSSPALISEGVTPRDFANDAWVNAPPSENKSAWICRWISISAVPRRPLDVGFEDYIAEKPILGDRNGKITDEFQHGQEMNYGVRA